MTDFDDAAAMLYARDWARRYNICEMRHSRMRIDIRAWFKSHPEQRIDEESIQRICLRYKPYKPT